MRSWPPSALRLHRQQKRTGGKQDGGFGARVRPSGADVSRDVLRPTPFHRSKGMVVPCKLLTGSILEPAASHNLRCSYRVGSRQGNQTVWLYILTDTTRFARMPPLSDSTFSAKLLLSAVSSRAVRRPRLQGDSTLLFGRGEAWTFSPEHVVTHGPSARAVPAYGSQEPVRWGDANTARSAALRTAGGPHL